MLKDKINRYVENLCKKAFVASKSAALNTSADRNNILKSYDYFLNDKYKVDINQLAINNVKNMFQ